MVDKIVILTDITSLNQKQNFQTVVMRTDGYKILSVLFFMDEGHGENTEYDSIEESIRAELYDDMYDDDLEILVEETNSASWVFQKICEYLCGYCASTHSSMDKHTDNETLVYFYNPNNAVFNFLKNEMYNSNGKVYLSKYSEIFVEGDSVYKNIVKVFEDLGMNAKELMKDSIISLTYFASAAVELIYG